MPAAWPPTRWWDWCMSEDQKKGIEPIFTDKNQLKKIWWEVVVHTRTFSTSQQYMNWRYQDIFGHMKT